MKNKLYILSLPIQSGKTTFLQNWLKKQSGVLGFLTPDIDGKRHFYDIKNQLLFPFQLMDSEKGVSIGKFNFDENIFLKGKEILQNANNQDFEWIIIDEIGRLEINQNLGWEPAFSQFLDTFLNQNKNQKAVVVIRDYLLNEAVTHYQIQNYELIIQSFFDSKEISELIGVVLAGGESSRMKTNKANLRYHKKPQAIHTAELLNTITKKVVISGSNDGFENHFEWISDDESFGKNGPISGLLSIIKKFPEKSVLLVGCDYPKLKIEDLLVLNFARNGDYEAIAFYDEKRDILEPIITIYEVSSFEKLERFHEQGNHSLRQFLGSIKTKKIISKFPDRLKSFDTPEDFASFES